MNKDYQKKRELALGELEKEIKKGSIYHPLVELLLDYNSLSYCFTLQSCYGHFVYSYQTDPTNLDPLPSPDTVDLNT